MLLLPLMPPNSLIRVYNAKPGSIATKKLYWYTRLGKIEIEEQVFTNFDRS
jgi:hypothetical protein